MTSTTTRILASVSEIAPDHDVWLCDIWGVVHNGVSAFADAHRALSAYRAQGGTVVLITNAPRPHDSVARQLDGLGVPRNAYDAIVTSGDVTRSLVAGLAGRPIFHLGPERDLPVFAGLDARLTDTGGAEAVVCTGLFDDATETPDHYADLLGRFRARSLPLICANPDLVVERGNSVVYCAGALAAAYEAIGGPVEYAGKPHRPIYDLALAAAETRRGGVIPKSRVLAVGDGLKTDMAGATGFGIPALFIPSAVHVTPGRALDQGLVSELFPEMSARPVAAIARLAW